MAHKDRKFGVPDEDNPEWTAEEIRTAKPFDEFFPATVVAAIKRRGRGPQKTPTKQMITLRLDGPVVAQWRASGRGWQSRMNETLARHAPKPTRPVKARAKRARS